MLHSTSLMNRTLWEHVLYLKFRDTRFSIIYWILLYIVFTLCLPWPFTLFCTFQKTLAYIMSFKRFFHWLIRIETERNALFFISHFLQSSRLAAFSLDCSRCIVVVMQKRWEWQVNCYQSGSQLLTWPKLLSFIAFTKNLVAAYFSSFRYFFCSGNCQPVHGCL